MGRSLCATSADHAHKLPPTPTAATAAAAAAGAAAVYRPAPDCGAAGQRVSGSAGQRDRRGRGWQRGQLKDERFMKTSRRSGTPQRAHG